MKLELLCTLFICVSLEYLHVSYTREAERILITSVCLSIILGDMFLCSFPRENGATISMKLVSLFYTCMSLIQTTVLQTDIHFGNKMQNLLWCDFDFSLFLNYFFITDSAIKPLHSVFIHPCLPIIILLPLLFFSSG